MKNINGIPIVDRWSTGRSSVEDFPIDEVSHNHVEHEIINENDDIGRAIDDIFGQ